MYGIEEEKISRTNQKKQNTPKCVPDVAKPSNKRYKLSLYEEQFNQPRDKILRNSTWSLKEGIG